MERASRSTKDLIIGLAITHCDEEGAWLITSADECHVGED
jgi:hypothetical protein